MVKPSMLSSAVRRESCFTDLSHSKRNCLSQGQEGLLKKDEVLQGQQDYATISSAVKSWQEAAASSQVSD